MKNSVKKQSKNEDFQTRRDFLQSAAAAGTALIFSPMISAGQESTENPDDINVALIGAGAQGQTLINACRNIPGVRFKAVCDIWADYNRSRTARILHAYGHQVNEYEDYQKMLTDEKTIDAAIIATPDFWHAEQTVACLKAGLHVYCEKEMSNTIEGARRMVQAARQTGKLLQIGRQRRSNPRYVHCYEKLIKEYELFGQIKAVSGQWNRTLYKPLGWPVNAPISQATLNKYGYESMEQFKNWQWYKGLGGGPIVDLGSHQIDIYNWFLEATPKTIAASGIKNYSIKNGYDWYDTVMVLCEYETSQGIVSAFYQTMPYDVRYRSFEKFAGEQGTLKISEYSSRDMIYPETKTMDSKKWLECIKEGNLTASDKVTQIIERITPDDLLRIFNVDETPDLLPLGQNNQGKNVPVIIDNPHLNLPIAIDKPYHQYHLENFFDAIRGKAKLNCPAEIGYETAVTVIKVNEAIEAGRRLEFKPEDFKV